MSFQKAIKRTLLSAFGVEAEVKEEDWIVEQDGVVSTMGSPWMLKSQPENNIFFVGERAFGSDELYGLEKKLDSIETLLKDITKIAVDNNVGIENSAV